MNLFKNLLVFIPIALSVGASQTHAVMLPVAASVQLFVAQEQKQVLSEKRMSLTDRYPNQWVNEVFADNILLNMAYFSGAVSNPDEINWDDVRNMQSFQMTLQPGEVFAFHDGVAAEYANKLKYTTNAHFNALDGFRSSGFLYGDGVCHLASLIHWAAKDAGLQVVAPVNHDFRLIPGIPQEFGTSIYYDPTNMALSEQQNLYVENNFDTPVTFTFELQNNDLVVRVEK